VGFEAVKLFLPGDVSAKIISGAKSVHQLVAMDIDSSSPPESQIASFLYGIKQSFGKRKEPTG
jgi:hypothetical protein